MNPAPVIAVHANTCVRVTRSSVTWLDWPTATLHHYCVVLRFPPHIVLDIGFK